MKWKNNFGKDLRKERLSWGMSRAKLAKKSHVDKETIEEIEKGLILEPDFYEMLNICEVLDTSVYFFLESKNE